MSIGGDAKRERAALVALAARTRGPWHLLARAVEEAGSAVRVAAGDRTGFETPDVLRELRLKLPVPEGDVSEVARMIDALEAGGVSLLTVLDDGYPTNLRTVYDRPPFLFVKGELPYNSTRAIAVVGTRQASSDGLDQAYRLARELVARDVTVVSGLARGIDGAAHRGALDAGGRTVAVMGTGIRRVYPAEHRDLADEIAEAGGALVSQFLPDSPGRPFHFPLRNRTMSGLALGTVVVEASATSGAKMQARLALEHGRRVFLVRDLVLREAWARRYAEHPAATVVDSVDDVLAVLDDLDRFREAEQLTLA